MATRRAFLRNGALALVGTSIVPAFLERSVLAQMTTAQARGKRLVVIFQRGAADGLNIVIPHAEPSYFSMRPTIAVPREQVLDLDGYFGLHPAMATLKPLWDAKNLAIVHAAGSPDTTRSHFDAQDYMESGTPGVKATADGWLNRALQAEDAARARKTSPFRRCHGHADAAHAARKNRSCRAQQLAGLQRRWTQQCGAAGERVV